MSSKSIVSRFEIGPISKVRFSNGNDNFLSIKCDSILLFVLVSFDTISASFDTISVSFDTILISFDTILISFDTISASFDTISASFNNVCLALDAM